MNHSEQDRLADEILQTDDLAVLRRSSLVQGLTVLRRRRKQRRALRLLAVGVTPVVLGLLLMVWVRPTSPSASGTGRQMIQTAASSAADSGEAIKFINDDELLALFTNRPVALIGKPGQQELVFLDELAAAHRAEARNLALGVQN